jgi:hypothetical protein
MFLYQRMDGNEKIRHHPLYFDYDFYIFNFFFFFFCWLVPTSGFCVRSWLCVYYRVKCAPIHARMVLGVPSALNVVPVTTMPVVITLMARVTACRATVAIK